MVMGWRVGPGQRLKPRAGQSWALGGKREIQEGFGAEGST